jgi:ferric-dicitrate binding protein FerR (iron transport regulator)
MDKEYVEYQDLIIKFLAGEIIDSEFTMLKSWLEKSPENRRIFDKENELWQETAFQSRLEHYKVDSAWSNISFRLGLGKRDNASVTVIRKSTYIFLIAAACLAGLIAIGSLYVSLRPKNIPASVVSASTTISTKEGEKAHIFLPDSTEIVLNSGSSIQYDRNYNIKDRIVRFTGEAYFNVATNHEKPFVVKLDHMNVAATGTRFNIFSFSNEDRVETTLEEGVIQVSIAGVDPIRMKSGEQIVYFVKSKKVQLSEVATDTYTSWKENKLRFNDTPFEEVLRRIGRKYNVRFEITSRDLLNLKYTATFIDESIEEVMQMLQTVSPITYKIYNLTTINDKKYTKPKIVVGKRKENKRIFNQKP